MELRGARPATLLPSPGGETPEQGVRQVARNVLALLLAYGLPKVFSAAGVVVAARVLGAADFGAYGTAAAYAVILSVVSTLGMMPLLIREIAREPARAPGLMRWAHRVKTVANAVMLLILWAGAAWILEYGDAVVAAALLLGLSYALGAYGENLAAWYKARERMEVWTQASALNGFVTGALGIVLVVATSSVVWFCVAPVSGQAAALAWLLYRAPAELRAPRGGAGTSASLVRALLPFAAAFLALTVYYKVDLLLLAHWRSAAEVGIYAAAYKFVDFLHALVLVGAVAVYPRLSRWAPEGARRERWAGTRVTELALLVAVPVAGALWLARSPAIGVLFGGAYSDSVSVLGLLALAVPALTVNLLAAYVLGAAERMDRVALLYGAGIVLNVGLNAWLIPRLGARGAGLAMLGSEWILAGGFLFALHHQASAFPGARSLAGAGGAALVCGLAALLPDTGLALGRLGVAGGGIVALYTLMRVVPRRELRILRAALLPGTER